VVAAAFAYVHLAENKGYALKAGSEAPGFRLPSLAGGEVDLASQRGKVVVLNFWATWCAPCREEMPALDAYYRRHRSEGLEVIAISMDNPRDEAKARELMRAFSFPAAFGREANISSYGRISSLPLTFIIDRYGVLRKDGRYGNPLLTTAILERTVTPLLRERMNSAGFAPRRTFAASSFP